MSNYIFEKINKCPIIIFSGQRTGSTALLHDIGEFFSNKSTFTIFNEPHHNEKNFLDFLNYTKTSNHYAVKFHAFYLNYYKPLFSYLKDKDYFSIRIRRKQVFNQIASHYISRSRQIWSYSKLDNNDESYTNDEVEIIDSKLRETIRHSLSRNNLLDNLDYKIDLDVFYEDFTFYNKSLKKNTATKKLQ